MYTVIYTVGNHPLQKFPRCCVTGRVPFIDKMQHRSILITVCLMCTVRAVSAAAASSREITDLVGDLPGFPSAARPFKTYSGILRVNASASPGACPILADQSALLYPSLSYQPVSASRHLLCPWPPHHLRAFLLSPQ